MDMVSQFFSYKVFLLKSLDPSYDEGCIQGCIEKELTIYHITHQKTALNSSNPSELVSKSVEAESEVFDSHANPNKEILIDNFRFTKAEDIMFALEMDVEYVFNFLCKKINEKPYTKQMNIPLRLK